MRFRLIKYCEFDKYACKSYDAIHNTTQQDNLGDICCADFTKLECADLIVGGSPCQDFSVAGQNKGALWTCKSCGYKYNPLEQHFSQRDYCPICDSEEIEKTRSSLVVEYLRAIRENKPKFFLYENVKNIIGKKNKPTFDLFIDELNEYGYVTYYKVLNAKDYGVPQNRERIILFGVKKELNNGFEFPIKQVLQLRLKDVLESNVDEKYYLSEKAIQGMKLTNFQSNKPETRIQQQSGTDATLLSRDYKDPKYVQVAQLNGEFESNGRIYDDSGLSPTINTMGGGQREPKIMQAVGDRGNHSYSVKDTAFTIPANPMSDRGQVVIEPVLVGGIGDINFGKQFRQGNRIYDSEAIAMALNASPVGNAGGESYLYKVEEPTILTPKRTEYGKVIRKDYEAGNLKESRHNFTQLEPKQEPTSNTITTVQKDNMLLEPLAYDEQNKILRNDGTVGTLTTDGSSPKHNNRVVEFIKLQQIGVVGNGGQGEKIYDCEGTCDTLATSHNGRENLIIVDENIKQCVRVNYEREKEQIAQSDKEIYQCKCNSGYQDNKVGIKVCPTSRSGNNHTAVYNNFRIRKLTPLECWRLMGFTDCAFYKAQKVVSKSQLYKQAGNSIVVNVIAEIYKQIQKFYPNDFKDDMSLISLFSGIGAFETAFDKV